MKVFYIIPANYDKGNLKFSPFYKTELNSMEKAGEIQEVFHFTNRMNLISFFNGIKDIRCRINKFNPDLVHCEVGGISSFLTLIAVKKTIPILLSFGGSEILGYPNKGFIWRLREKLVFVISIFVAYKVHLVRCVSKNIFNKLPIDIQSKSIVLPRGVDLKLFYECDRNKAREKLGWDTDKVYGIFNYSTSLKSVKNFTLAKKAFKLFKQKYSKDSSDLFILNNMSQEEVALAMNAADVLLLTSYHEGSPNIIKEALACNLPIVTVNCGDVEERLKDVFPSLIVTYDADALANAIYQVTSKGGNRSNGRLRLKQQGIDLDSTSLRLSQVYNDLITVLQQST